MKDKKKLWELICYFGGILGFIVTSILAPRFAPASAGAMAITVVQLIFMAAVCVGCVLGIVRTRKFSLDNFLRGAVLLVIGGDLIRMLIRLFA